MIRSTEERISFDRITDFVYLGSRVSSVDDFHRLGAHGIRAAVDMREEGGDPWHFHAFLWLPTVDHTPPSVVHLKMGIAFLRQCERARLPVFVHCTAGVGRSPTMVLAHLLAGAFRESGTTAALEHIAARRGVINPSPAQIRAAEAAAREFAD